MIQMFVLSYTKTGINSNGFARQLVFWCDNHNDSIIFDNWLGILKIIARNHDYFKQKFKNGRNIVHYCNLVLCPIRFFLKISRVLQEIQNLFIFIKKRELFSFSYFEDLLETWRTKKTIKKMKENYMEMYYICQCLVSQGTIFILYIIKINYDSNGINDHVVLILKTWILRVQQIIKAKHKSE